MQQDSKYDSLGIKVEQKEYVECFGACCDSDNDYDDFDTVSVKTSHVSVKNFALVRDIYRFLENSSRNWPSWWPEGLNSGWEKYWMSFPGFANQG